MGRSLNRFQNRPSYGRPKPATLQPGARRPPRDRRSGDRRSSSAALANREKQANTPRQPAATVDDVYNGINQAAGLLDDVASPARNARMAMRFAGMLLKSLPPGMQPDAWLPLKPQSRNKAEGQPFVHFHSQFGHEADILLPFDPTGETVNYITLNENFSPLGALVSGNPQYTPARWVHHWWQSAGAVNDFDLNNALANPNGQGWTMLDMGTDSDHFFQITCFTGSPAVAPDMPLDASVQRTAGPAVSSGTDRLVGTLTTLRPQALPSAAPGNNIQPAFQVGKAFTMPMRWQKPREAYDLRAGTLIITRSTSPRPGGAVRPGAGVADKPNPFQRPPKGTREQKFATKSAAAFRLAQNAFHWLSEVADGFDAIYDALPGKYRRGAKNRLDKSQRLWEHWDKVDLTDALVNLIHNHYEDKLLGKFFGAEDRAGKRLGIASYKFDNSVTGGGPSDGLLEAYGAFSKKYVNPSKEQIKAFLNSLD